MVTEVEEVLSDVRENIVEHYQLWFKQAVELVQQSDYCEGAINNRNEVMLKQMIQR